ncbi:MAG: 4-(cytidine 5'-diphospho)-2-C-methyl-D-erythritol kinase [Prevotella sp.]|nr:4-(cytidine 5'-diphospho)-2-C-methyl-D-erythritol kinase [Prevotella sp.]
MKVYPIAKINLGLSVLRKRPDLYHDIETIFYPISLKDELEIELQDKGSSLELNLEGISIQGDVKSNIIYKAYYLLKELYPQITGVKIHLKKNIPVGAGLGGGSSDAAYTIKALDEIFSLGITKTQMLSIASQLGADCAFFIDPKPSYATARGEELKEIDVNLSGKFIAIVKPPIFISTRQAYSLVKPSIPKISCLDVIYREVSLWKKELKNDFEESLFKVYPELKEIKTLLYGLGAQYAAMSGSGSSIYGIFSSKPKNIEKSFPSYFTAVIEI